MLFKLSRTSAIPGLIVALALAAYAENRTQLKPGWNLFSPDHDAEMGKEVAKEAESELQILNDRRGTLYRCARSYNRAFQDILDTVTFR